MKWNELLRELKKAGFYLIRQGKGSHQIWGHKDGREITVKPTAKEVPTGLANRIKKDAGIR